MCYVLCAKLFLKSLGRTKLTCHVPRELLAPNQFLYFETARNLCPSIRSRSREINLKDLFHFLLGRYNKALENKPHRQTMIFVLLDPQRSLKQRWTKLAVSLEASQETWRRTEGFPKFKIETHSVLTVTYRRSQFSELVAEIKQFTRCQQNHVQISHHERCKQQVLFLNNYLW